MDAMPTMTSGAPGKRTHIPRIENQAAAPASANAAVFAAMSMPAPLPGVTG